MRLIGLAVAAMVLAAAPAGAAWNPVNYPQFGFGVDFPAAPKMSKGQYQAVVAGKVETTIYAAEMDDTTYRVVIADFRNRLEDTPGILIEAAFIASSDGKVVADTMSRTDNGPKFAKYGRRVAVLTPDGGKKVSEFYFVAGRLLNFEAVISPKGDIGNPEIGRFADSIRFNMERDWTVPPPLPADPADGPRIGAPIRPGQGR